MGGRMETAIPWELFGGAFGLSAEVFQKTDAIPHGLTGALLIVLLAQLSLAIGQIIVLFVNRVKPIRFVFSLLISAVLYTFGFLFLVFSTWLICQLPWSASVSFLTLVKVLGLSYAPLLFGFLGALPYLGEPILTLLSVWHLLAMVVGFNAVTQVGIGEAVGYVAFGWAVKQILEHTIGQPIAKFGKSVADWVAGVKLAENQEELVQIIKAGLGPSSPILAAEQLRSARQSFEQSAELWLRTALRQRVPSPATSIGVDLSTSEPVKPEPTRKPSKPEPTIDPVSSAIPPASGADSGSNSGVDAVANQSSPSSTAQALGLVAALLGMVLLFVLVAFSLRPIQLALLGWHDNLPELLQVLVDLAWLGVIALVFAGLLAPLETLGWWAGWYDDDVATAAETQSRATATPTGDSLFPTAPTSAAQPVPPAFLPLAQTDAPSRYVIYLDGIGQSGEEYTPDVEDFLAALLPTLPKDVAFIRGLMMYSVLNKPLDQDRPLAFLWRMADKMRWSNPAALLGVLLNLRNLIIVAVSADKRYGPIYNQGIAQVLYNGLIERNYQPGSGVPVTLVGFSGGAQMSVAAAPYLRRAIEAPIEVISLGGVISANNNFLKLDHLYHLVGDRDVVERCGPIFFPGRWKLFPLSYWNRAKRQGKISITSLGPVGHQVPGGIMDPDPILPDGRSPLQQTVDLIQQILTDQFLAPQPAKPKALSNYDLYKRAAFNDPAYYPLEQTVDPNWYHPIGTWMGRLILPQLHERQAIRGVLFEVHHADRGYEHLVGQIVKLRWIDTPLIKSFVQAARHDVHFSAAADYSSEYGGLVHPERLNHWRQVGPLESLAGAHPTDDLIVMLDGEVQVEDNTTLRIVNQPVQITGRYYGLVRFLQPIAGSDQFRVEHFNPTTGQFDGGTEIVRLPPVIADQNGCFPSTTRALEQSPLNEMGWYIYGAKDGAGLFVVQSYAPRSLLRLQPDQVIFGYKPAYRYIRKQTWANIKAKKGQISSVLLSPELSLQEPNAPELNVPELDAQELQELKHQQAIDAWPEGTRALVLHTYGGIGGQKREPAAATPLFFGHFAYGLATVVRDPLTHELRFEIQYYQVYTHNTDGIVAGTLHWSRYMGDRQFGWAGVRPVCDLLVKLDAFTEDFEIYGYKSSPLNLMLRHLQVMTARYRIGDGTGGTYVGLANNCSQDSNQALFASLNSLERAIEADAVSLQNWLSSSQQASRYQRLVELINALQRELQPLGAPRSDWQKNEYNLGCTLEDSPLRNFKAGLGSWRTLLPRLASDTVVRIFLQFDASVWVLRTNQIGGYDPDIEPIAPMTL
ncbi:CAAX protease [Leptolyngbya sp. NK1-12]|uniref:CAAX protease n=2 Tax=Leptolyngbya sp. NK1-12 TaxID=2547451 RepID=A0AA97AEI0_9CYAN|nr:CAAX protease [Leptolyngbya sp. NK1-12]